MLNLDPYKTNFGSLINIQKTKDILYKYLILNNAQELSYEFNTNESCIPVFITGYNTEEQELPVFDHPVIIPGKRDTVYIVTDVRKYLKKLTEQPLNIMNTTIVRDMNSLQFVTTLTVILTEYYNGNSGVFRTHYKEISLGMSAWLGNGISALVGLDPVEKSHVEIVIAHYCNMLLTNNKNISEIQPTVDARVSKMKFSLPIANKALHGLLGTLNYTDVTIEDCIGNIQAVLSEEKRRYVDLNSLVNVISNSWFGPGSSETVLISIDNAPTWITLFYLNLENKSYKRSRLATLLMNNKRRLNSDEVVKFFNNYIQDKIS